MKIAVDFDVCQCHGLCVETAPTLFEIRDDGFLYLLNDTPPQELTEQAEKAMLECPAGAISITAARQSSPSGHGKTVTQVLVLARRNHRGDERVAGTADGVDLLSHLFDRPA